jgi:cytochrome P450
MEFILSNFHSTAIVGLIAAFLCVLVSKLLGGKSRKYPPMIASLPVVGSLPFLPSYSNLHTFFTEKSQTMGGIIGCYMGRKFTIVLNGKEAIVEGLSKRVDFSSRPKAFSKSLYLNKKYKGIGEHMYDDHFRRSHQVAIGIMKEFGYGKSVMEFRISQEINKVVEDVKKFNGKAFYPEEIATSGFLNVILSILFNKTYHDMNDPELKRWIELVKLFFTEYYDFMAVDSFEWLMILPYYKKKLQENIEHKAELMEFIQKGMMGALANVSQGESFVSSYMNKEGNTDYDYQQLIYVLRDIVLGGTETISSSLQWFLVFMANNLDKQDKLQAEIDAVVGRREITLEDERNMPYTQAAVLEQQRRITIAALALPHCSMKDTTIRDFFVPENSNVIVNLYSAHMDPKVWPNPFEYIPERFIGEDGNVVGKDRMVMFSMGKRTCFGEQLARQELFLSFATIAQQFRILPPEGEQKIVVQEVVFLNNAPSHFTVRMIPRYPKASEAPEE